MENMHGTIKQDDCEREQNSQPDALIFDILDKNEDIGSERNRFLRKKVRNDCNVVLLQESFTAEKRVPPVRSPSS